MRVLITGASGFVGKNLLKGFPDTWDITALYRSSKGFEQFVQGLSKKVTLLQCDLTNINQTKSALSGKEFDACVHLAANGDPRRGAQEPLFDLHMNTYATLSLIESGAHINKFIYFSSGAVYEGLTGDVGPDSNVRPFTPYSIDKWASEQHIKHYQSLGVIDQYVIVRFFGCYGPYEPERKIYGKLLRKFAIEKDPNPELYGDGLNKIYAMYVDDTVLGVQKIIESKTSNVTVDFCGHEQYTLKELVTRAAKVFEIEPELSFSGEGAVEKHIFNVSTKTMQNSFDFTPSISLENGLKLYGEHLK